MNLPANVKRKMSKREMKHSYSNILICSTISIATILLALYQINELEPEAKIQPIFGANLFVLGLLFFISFYKLMINLLKRTALGQRMIKEQQLNTADILDISNKIVSSIQAVFSCIAGLTICRYSCGRNLLRTSHYISHAYSWFGASYFFYDIWSMYNVHVNTPPGTERVNTPSTQLVTPIGPKQHQHGLARFLQYVRLNPIIVAHHLFIGIFGFSVIIYFRGNLGDCVFGFVFLMEASTPFVSIRSVLSRFQLKSSKVYIVNGFLMVAVFFACRVFMFPYVMHLYANAINTDYISAIASLPTGCKLSISILMFPQLYWFWLMMKGATKILRRKSSTTNGVAKRLKAN